MTITADKPFCVQFGRRVIVVAYEEREKCPMGAGPGGRNGAEIMIYTTVLYGGVVTIKCEFIVYQLKQAAIVRFDDVLHPAADG